MRSHEGGVPEPVDGICRTVGDAVSKVGEGLFRVRHEEPGLVLLPKVPERRTKRERRNRANIGLQALESAHSSVTTPGTTLTLCGSD